MQLVLGILREVTLFLELFNVFMQEMTTSVVSSLNFSYKDDRVTYPHVKTNCPTNFHISIQSSKKNLVSSPTKQKGLFSQKSSKNRSPNKQNPSPSVIKMTELPILKLRENDIPTLTSVFSLLKTCLMSHKAKILLLPKDVNTSPD